MNILFLCHGKSHTNPIDRIKRSKNYCNVFVWDLIKDLDIGSLNIDFLDIKRDTDPDVSIDLTKESIDSSPFLLDRIDYYDLIAPINCPFIAKKDRPSFYFELNRLFFENTHRLIKPDGMLLFNVTPFAKKRDPDYDTHIRINADPLWNINSFKELCYLALPL